jgi:spermidine synthase
LDSIPYYPPVALVLACFFLSGATALVFETLWTRMLVLVFGATSLAQSTVLAAFMGGLALGSALGGRLADRSSRPLRLYGLCQGGIGIYALFLPKLIAAYPGLARALTASHTFWALSLGRFVLSVAALIVPTTLMGTTLPLLSRHVVRLPAEMGRAAARISRLYAANTFGAVLGAAAATFVLLPTLGLSHTHLFAAIADLLLMAVVLLVARRPRVVDPLAEIGTAEASPPVAPALRRLAVGAFCLSGAAAMANQILWTRALSMVIGSSIYSFTLVLLAFLLGLAGGAAALGGFAARTRRPVAWLGALNLGVALLCGWTYVVMDDLPDLFLGLLRDSSFDPGSILAMQMLLALVAVLPPTVLMGATLPVTLRVAAADAGRLGRDVGRAYAANTCGAIAGSLCGGFVLLPAIGIRSGLVAAGTANLVLAAALLSAGLAPGRLRRLAWALPLGLAIAAVRLPAWNLLRLSSGVFRVSIAREHQGERPGAEPELAYYRDGLATTVSVEKWAGNLFSLKNNGKVDASTGDDMPTQIMVGLLPVLLHPDHGLRPLSVLVIGYASGVTVGSVLQADVGHVDVVELERATLQASRFFERVNHRPLADPRVRLIIDDGRNWLASRKERYDVIISEPSNPWITGVSNLFTRDYYRLARERLRPGGIFCSWAQLYEMAPSRIKAIYRAFAESFPSAQVFSAEDVSSDTFLIGTTGGAGAAPRLDLAALSRGMALPRVAAELGRAAVRSPHDLVSFLLLDPDELAAFVSGVEANTDDNLIVELSAPLDLYAAARPSFVTHVYAGQWPYGHLRGWLSGWEREPGRAERYAALAESLLRYGRRREAEWFLGRAGDGPTAARTRRLHDLLTAEDVDLPEVPLAGSEGLEPPRPPSGLDAAAQARFAQDYLAVESRLLQREYADALSIVDGWPKDYVGDPGDDFLLLHGVLLFRAEKYGQAAARLAPLVRDGAHPRPAALFYYGVSAYSSGHYRAGTDALLRWLATEAPRHR